MSFVDTIDPSVPPGPVSPGYLRRRAGDDKAVAEHRRSVGAVYPGAATAEVASRHYQRRATDDRTAAASGAAVALAPRRSPPVLPSLQTILPHSAEVTAELRRRILAAVDAGQPARRSRSIAWAIAGGLSLLLWLGIAGLIVAVSHMVASLP